MAFFDRRLRALLAACALALFSPISSAGLWPDDWSVCPGIQQPADTSPGAQNYELYFSPHTHHWNPSDEHKQVVAVSLTRLLPSQRFCGVSLFSNSFGQPSAYAFTGKYWTNLFQSMPNVYLSLSGGIMYGYVGQYKDKVPLNVGGFSPVIVPAVGYRLTPNAAVEVQVLGSAAIMFGATWRY